MLILFYFFDFYYFRDSRFSPNGETVDAASVLVVFIKIIEVKILVEKN